MAKTYTTVGTVSAGDVYTAAAHNIIATDVNNLTVKPAVSVYRSSALTSYTSGLAITWQAEHYDTDSMWSSGSGITIGTTGLYHLSFAGQASGSATITLVIPQITRSGTNILSGQSGVANGNESRFALSGIVDLTAGDTLTASLFMIGGSAYAIGGNATYGENQTRLVLNWLGLKA